jgi:acetylornithine deacetylase/succinyl-diaminopimelate desuccinylase-like protein
VLIEASEESGSPDLPAYIDDFVASGVLPDPSLVVCLDSGAGSYDRLWLTTSLRGLVGLTIKVAVLGDGVHSGSAGGVVPSSFRVLRQLLDRIEDSTTGRVLLPELWTSVPDDRVAEIAASAPEMGEEAGGVFPYLQGVQKQAGDDPAKQLTARTWEPSIAYVGLDGMPPTHIAGNVLRASTTLGLAIRIPPTVDAQSAADALVRVLSESPPSGAHVEVRIQAIGDGWNAAPFEPWLQEAAEAGSQAAFGRSWCTLGEGGSIPFMAMLGRRFPSAQFCITGALGPENGAHGPNEFLHVPAATAMTEALAHILDAHATR